MSCKLQVAFCNYGVNEDAWCFVGSPEYQSTLLILIEDPAKSITWNFVDRSGGFFPSIFVNKRPAVRNRRYGRFGLPMCQETSLTV
jgi:hypothetical protein